jgi:hypothetical protein
MTAWKTYAYFLGGAPALNTATNVALRPLDDTSSNYDPTHERTGTSSSPFT